MSNARGYPPYPPRGKKPHGPSRCRFYTGPPSSRRSRDQDGRDLLYDLHTITGQSEGTHTHATQTKRREHRTGPAVREAEPEVRNTGDGVTGESNGEREDSRRATGGERGLLAERVMVREVEEAAEEEEEEEEAARRTGSNMGRIAKSRSGFESWGCRDVDERQSAWAAQ